MAMGIDSGIVVVDIHDIEERATGYGILGVAKVEDVAVDFAKPALGVGEKLLVGLTVVEPTTDA